MGHTDSLEACSLMMFSTHRLKNDTGTALLTTQDFPSDLDTTSLALTILDNINDDERVKIMTKMLGHVNTDGITQVKPSATKSSNINEIVDLF
jgi:NifB/MoaA-like Fe-S oxidoreductase